MHQSIELGLEDTEDEIEEELFLENGEPTGEDPPNEEANNENEIEDSQKTTKTKAVRKKIVRNPHFKLDAARLSCDRGLASLPGIFCKLNWKGKGQELADLQKLMRHLEHWCHRLYPRLPFDDVLERIEQLGKKKETRVNITKIRLDIPFSNADIPKDDDDEDQPTDLTSDADKAWDEMIKEQGIVLTQEPSSQTIIPHSLPKKLSEEQQKRIEENKQLARKRRAEKLEEISSSQKVLDNSSCVQPTTVTETTIKTAVVQNSEIENSKIPRIEIIDDKSVESILIQDMKLKSCNENKQLNYCSGELKTINHSTELENSYESVNSDTPVQSMEIAETAIANMKADDVSGEKIHMDYNIIQSNVSNDISVQKKDDKIIELRNITPNKKMINLLTDDLKIDQD